MEKNESGYKSLDSQKQEKVRGAPIGGLDINQVSMSSIEPASNVMGMNSKAQIDINQTQGTEHDEQERLQKVDEIPQFTIGPSGNNFGQQEAPSKKYTLKKNAFDSDLALTVPANEGFQQSPKKEPGLSKSANQARVLRMINENTQQTDMGGMSQISIGQDEIQDQEMRETSYFKQQTDDEKATPEKKNKEKSLSELIMISNNQRNMQQANVNRTDERNKEPVELAVSENSSRKGLSNKNQNSMKEGIQMFKISSKSQMKQNRASVRGKKVNVSLAPGNSAQSEVSHQDDLGLYIGSPKDIEVSQPESTKSVQHMYSNAIKIQQQESPVNRSKGNLKQQISADPNMDPSKEINMTGNFGALKLQKQFMSGQDRNNFSVLKGNPEVAVALDVFGRQDSGQPNEQDPIFSESIEPDTAISKEQPGNKQMFTSMSDIGFPQEQEKRTSGLHGRGKLHELVRAQSGNMRSTKSMKGELLSIEQIQKLKDTNNNWRVRTTTIDQILHDVMERVEKDQDYIMFNSERLIDFFVAMLSDQNFKIVLNSLHILNLIVTMPLQLQRYDIIMRRPEELPQDVINGKQSYGLNAQFLGRHIPQLVKKLADSKAIIRQEAIKCLFGMNEIMRSGHQKDNNFIALILPYLNNSSNWHIREELLNLLIKTFIYSGNQGEFDCYQILDSILQLLNDTKEKVRSLALEAIAAFASIGEVNKISEVMFQLNIAKEVADLVQQRLEQGIFPQLASDGSIEVPYLDNAAPTYDVDSVAHSMTQASQQGIHNSAHQDLSRRKPSIGGGSQSGISYKNVNQTPSQGMVLNPISIPSNLIQVQHRGNSSGRKIVVGTANANTGVGGGLLVSQQDEMAMQQFMQSKRTASANAPGQFDPFQPQQQNLNQNLENGSGHYPSNSFNYSINGNQPSKRNKEGSNYIPQFLDEVNSVDNGQSFLPQLQKNQFSSYSNHRERTTAGGGGSSISGSSHPHNPDMPISMTSKRANKYIHGTPGHNVNYNNHVHLSGHQQSHFGARGNSGRKLVSNHQLNSMTSDQSPSLFDHQMSIPMRRDGTGQVTTFFEMSGNVAHMVQPHHDLDGSHFKHMSALGGSVGAHQNLGQWIQYSQLQSEQGYTNMASADMSEVNSLKGGHPPIHYDNQAQDPDFDRQVIEERKNSNSRQRIQDSHKLKAINIQNQKRGTFYSEATNVTGTTAATGLTSKVPQGSAAQPEKNFADQPSLQNFQVQMANVKNGPIKATRAALAVSIPANQADDGGTLIIDSRRYKGHQPLSTKGNKRNSRGPYDDNNDSQNQVNKSFSHVDHERNLNDSHMGLVGQDPQSAGLRRSGFMRSDDAPIGEGNDPALVTQSSKIQYIDFEDLEPLDNAAKQFQKSTAKGQGIFSQSDWQAQFDGCNIFRSVMKHHQSLILQNAGNQLQNIIGSLLKLADSLRSAVSKVSLVTIKEMFISLKRVMEPSLDPIIKILLKKGSDTNQFIAQEADLCIIAMIQNCQEMKVLQILQMQNMQSRSNLFRLKICQCLLNIVKQLGNNILFFNQNDKLLIYLAKYLMDASQDVRAQAKEAFVAMSQAIMGQNELEKLLQRVLNEAQYKKVKELLDKEPVLNSGQLDFVITTSSQQQNGKRTHGSLGSQKASLKALRPNNKGGVAVMTDRVGSNIALNEENPAEPLQIQARSMMNPLQKQDSGSLHGRNSQQKSKQPKIADSTTDHFFTDSVKDLILKTSINEWRQRFEATEQLFDLLKANLDKFQKPFKMLDLADCLCKLINDTNAKIQLCTLENFGKLMNSLVYFIEGHLQLFYKALLQNLGSSNLGVRKASDQCLTFLLQNMQPERLSTLLQPLVNMIQHTNNARLKAALVDQLVELLQDMSKSMDSKEAASSVATLVHKHATPLAIKLMDDNKSEFKLKCDKLLKKLYLILGQQALFDATPQSKLGRVTNVCLGQALGASGDVSNGKSSQGFNTGTFGANGNQLFLNSRN